jgi:hypothetical protein
MQKLPGNRRLIDQLSSSALLFVADFVAASTALFNVTTTIFQLISGTAGAFQRSRRNSGFGGAKSPAYPH